MKRSEADEKEIKSLKERLEEKEKLLNNSEDMLQAEVLKANYLRNRNTELIAKNEELTESKGLLEDEKRKLRDQNTSLREELNQKQSEIIDLKMESMSQD